MSIFKRMRDITTATINDMLDHMEDPVSMLNQYLRDIEQEISHAELSLARHVAMESKLKNLVEETGQRISKRVRQTKLAVENGQDDIARQAIKDRQTAEQRLDDYRRELETIRTQTQTVRSQLQELKDKYYEMKSKKTALAARANAAQTSKRMSAVLSSLDTESAAKGFQRIEERIIGLEAEAYAGEYVRRNNVSYGQEVEEELNRLKSQRAEEKTAADIKVQEA